jgi:hypothetical protein
MIEKRREMEEVHQQNTMGRHKAEIFRVRFAVVSNGYAHPHHHYSKLFRQENSRSEALEIDTILKKVEDEYLSKIEQQLLQLSSQTPVIEELPDSAEPQPEDEIEWKETETNRIQLELEEKRLKLKEDMDKKRYWCISSLLSRS